MPSYIFLAAAVVVIIAIGVVGVLLIRRGRRAAEEEAFLMGSHGEDLGEGDRSSQQKEPEAEPAPVALLAEDHLEPESPTAAELEGGLLGIGPLLGHETPPCPDSLVVPEPMVPPKLVHELPAGAEPVPEPEASPAPESEVSPTAESESLPMPEAEAAPTVVEPPTEAQQEPQVDEAAGPLADGSLPTEPQAAPEVERDYLLGVERLLAEWRARHEMPVVRGPSHRTLRPEGQGRPGVAGSALALAEFSPEQQSLATSPIGNDVSKPSVPEATAAEARVPLTSVEAPAALEVPAAEEPPVRTSTAAFAAPAEWPSLSVFDAAEYEVGAADLATHAVLLDPLGVVILKMVDGKGKLGTAELKRLEVFCPDRVELAARAMELPPRLQNDEDAVLRLAQIQLYAATLELRSKWSARVSARSDFALAPPFSARDFKLKIARDIMDLPAVDRSEVIGYLLGGLLGSDESTTELKRAVIDVLEYLHSATLANVLLECLDDPNPIVQEYALAAADRLLAD